MILSRGFLIHKNLLIKVLKCKEGESFYVNKEIAYSKVFDSLLFSKFRYDKELIVEILRTFKFFESIKYNFYYDPEKKNKEIKIEIIKKPKFLWLYLLLINTI